jgi:hypothetical protein
LAEDTDTVLAHADRMTIEARRTEAERHHAAGRKAERDIDRHVAESRLVVTPREAMVDLLEIRHEPAPANETESQKKARLHRAKLRWERIREASELVVREAHDLLVTASNAYTATAARLRSSPSGNGSATP